MVPQPRTCRADVATQAQGAGQRTSVSCRAPGDVPCTRIARGLQPGARAPHPATRRSRRRGHRRQRSHRGRRGRNGRAVRPGRARDVPAGSGCSPATVWDRRIGGQPSRRRWLAALAARARTFAVLLALYSGPVPSMSKSHACATPRAATGPGLARASASRVRSSSAAMT